MPEPVFAFAHATIARDGAEVIRDLTWTVRPGEAWAVVGPTASGKSTLLEVIAGKHRLAAGRFDPPAGAVKRVAFKEDSRRFGYGDKYYQQRYEFADADEPFTLGDYLGPGGTWMAELVGLGGRWEQPFLTLSNGQTRRARLARALLGSPDVLLLDDPFVGLDAAGRADLGELLAAVAKQRCVVVAGAEPGWATNTLRLEASGPRERAGTPPDRGDAFLTGGGQYRPAHAGRSPSEPVIDLRDVTVRHGGRDILSHVSWTVRAGERWALVGPNGAGKTTLLSLIVGDHPQAFSNHVELFGRRRGTGETIWDVKRNVGFVSPEFHLYFAEDLTAAEAAATGFTDTLLYREPTPEQAERVRELFAAFGAEDLMPRRMRRLSVGQQRLALVVRALVKRPKLLVLDEPFQGLDAATANRVRDWLDANLTDEQTLVFVTHVPDEVPAGVTRTLRLDGGRVV